MMVQISNYLNKKIRGFLNIGYHLKRSNLYISRHERIGSKVIGIDRIKRKLLFLKNNHHSISCYVIDLKEVKTCTVKKIFKGIEAGGLKNRKLEEYLTSISLYLRFKNENKTIALPFYETHVNTICEIPELESKAKSWMAVLSQMLPLSLKESVI